MAFRRSSRWIAPIFTCQKARLGKRGGSNANHTLDQNEPRNMGLSKPEFYHFFVVGFAVGVVLVVTMMDTSTGNQLREGMISVADAASTK
jgi:hypothetical protein